MNTSISNIIMSSDWFINIQHSFLSSFHLFYLCINSFCNLNLSTWHRQRHSTIYPSTYIHHEDPCPFTFPSRISLSDTTSPLIEDETIEGKKARNPSPYSWQIDTPDTPTKEERRPNPSIPSPPTLYRIWKWGVVPWPRRWRSRCALSFWRALVQMLT